MDMESLTGAIHRLRETGYESDFVALSDGALRCSSCDAVCDPGDATVDEIVRFEGPTDPGDAAILVALRCGCGHPGLFSSAYGVDAPPEDASALRCLAAEG